jgi:tRNA uridine 5-carboxymethylaminomethyl modification enzyme
MENGMRLLKKSKVENVAADIYLKRPEIDWQQMCQLIPELTSIEANAAQQCLYDIKYEGYISRQRVEVERQQRHAGKRIPPTFDYNSIGPLRNEAKEKLSKIRPLNLDQAKRISGITPADLALVLAHMESKRKT